jgi:hypothetical protein
LPACPAGLGIAAFIGLLFVSFWSVVKNIWQKLRTINENQQVNQ